MSKCTSLLFSHIPGISVISTFLMAIWLINPRPVSAQGQDSLRQYLIDEVTVTATRTTKQVDETGRSVTVISREEIKASGHQTLGGLLSRQPGFYIVGTGQTPGALQSTYLRGATNNQTVILIDGVRLTDPSSTDNSIDLAELSLAGIQRVEIVRGSHSTLYGSSAIGGVINIITRKHWEPGFHALAELEGSIFGSEARELSEQIQLNYTFQNGIYGTAIIGNRNVRGLDATLDSIADPTVFRTRDQDGFNKTDMIGMAGFRNRSWDLFAMYKRIDQQADIDDGAFNDDENYTSDVGRDVVSYGLKHIFNLKFSIDFSGGYSALERYIEDDSSVIDAAGTTDHSYFDANYKGTTIQNEIQANLQLKGVEFVAGGGMSKETMSSRSYFINTQFGFSSEDNFDTLGIEANSTNLYLQAELNGLLIDPDNSSLGNLSLILGSRLTRHSNYGTHVTYEINPSVQLQNDMLLYASMSSGFNTPALYRLFAPNMDFTSGITRGNPDLQPETSVSLEMGMKKKIGNRTRLGIAMFHTVTDNFIDFVYLWEKSISIDSLGNDWLRNDYRGDTYLNIGRQTAMGVEAYFETNLSDKFYLSGNVSLINGKLEYDAMDIDAGQTNGHHVQLYSNGQFLRTEIEVGELIRRPHTVNLSLTYKPKPYLSVRTDLKYAAERDDIYYDASLGPFGALATQPVGNYLLTDLSGQYAFKKHLTASLRIENIFNTQYQEILGYATRGRGLYLSIRYER